MNEQLLQHLTATDHRYACAFAEKIISESKESHIWYPYFDDFASLLSHPNSLVRNRALSILAANVQWDFGNRFDAIFAEYISHVTDPKPITARQCVKTLAQIGVMKPQYIPQILERLEHADLSQYNDSMRPLIEKDIAETKKRLIPFSMKK